MLNKEGYQATMSCREKERERMIWLKQSQVNLSVEENIKTARNSNLSPDEALLVISALFPLIFLADALSSEIKIQVKS